jgi:polysaccharide export outer membrane protein
MALRGTVSAIVACTLFCLGCAGGAPPYEYKTEPDPRRVEFQIGPLDQLSINVWKNREMSAEVTVRPDGIVTLPLIGDVKAAGRTPSELHKEIAKRLAEFVRSEDLIVSVGVTAVNSYTFTVIGAAERSGYYSPRTYVSIVEAVAMAGGPNRYAGNYVYIVRGNPARRIPIDMRRATTSEHADENLIVMRGDIIIIP